MSTGYYEHIKRHRRRVCKQTKSGKAGYVWAIANYIALTDKKRQSALLDSFRM